jgi:hypothetical protein
MAGSMWWRKAAHLKAAWKKEEREEGDKDRNTPLKDTL